MLNQIYQLTFRLRKAKEDRKETLRNRGKMFSLELLVQWARVQLSVGYLRITNKQSSNKNQKEVLSKEQTAEFHLNL